MNDSSSTVSQERLYQDVVSQLPLLDAYSNFLGIFELSDDSDRDSIVSSVRIAFQELKNKVPWLDYEVVNTSSGAGDTGYFRARPWPAGMPRNDFFVKDCDRLVASFAELARAGFPASMLPAAVLEPWPSLPTRAHVSPAPVSAIQLNFVRGGVIMTVSKHHVMVDGTGIHAFRRMLSAMLRGQDIPEHELAGANMDRTRVIPLLAEGETMKDHSHLLSRTLLDTETKPPPRLPTPARWCVFRISRQAVEEITSLARDRRSQCWVPGVTGISTNDALAAFCWQRITAARLPALLRRRGGDKAALPFLTQIKRAIDARRVMGVPASYMGHMVYHASVSLPLSTVASAPLPFLACAVRRALDEVNNPWAVRSYATFLSRQPDRSGLLYGGPHNWETDIGLSSLVTTLDWEGNHSLDYGPLLGRSAVWRKADHTPIPGCLYFFDTESDAGANGEGGSGELVLSSLLCLPNDDLDALLRDPTWTKYFVPVVEQATKVKGSCTDYSKL